MQKEASSEIKTASNILSQTATICSRGAFYPQKPRCQLAMAGRDATQRCCVMDGLPWSVGDFTTHYSSQMRARAKERERASEREITVHDQNVMS